MKTRIKQIFIKIKQGHKFWKNGSSEYRERLENIFNPLFTELEGLGVSRTFSESLLFWGKEFADSLGDKSEAEDLEIIFEAKAENLTEKELREYRLAQKNNALIYRSLPIKGDKVGVTVLVKKS